MAKSPAKRQAGAMRTWPLVAPCIVLMAIWTTLPLLATIYYSFRNFNLLNPMLTGFAGLDNYHYLLTDPTLYTAIGNTLVLVGSVICITILVGVVLAYALDHDFPGRDIARILSISPFFIMPTVAALIWKNLLMHPINGVFASWAHALGFNPIDWFTQLPMLSIVMIISWQWIPFATLILVTALQSLDREQLEAAVLDGARGFATFRYIILPFLSRPIAIVAMIEVIFLFSAFAEILVTTGGGPGTATTNLTYLIYTKALLQWDVGGGSAAGIIAIIVANILALVLVTTVVKNFSKP